MQTNFREAMNQAQAARDRLKGGSEQHDAKEATRRAHLRLDEPRAIDFTLDAGSETRLARPGSGIFTVSGFEVAAAGDRVTWLFQARGDFDPVRYETGTAARRGTYLMALLGAFDYPLTPEALAMLRPEWFVGREVRAEITWTRDPHTGVPALSVTSILALENTDANKKPKPWELPRAAQSVLPGETPMRMARDPYEPIMVLVDRDGNPTNKRKL